MASRINSGGSNDLNCIKIDPRTGEKFSFIGDIEAAPGWQHPQLWTFIHARESFHVSSNGGVFVIVLYITSLSTNTFGRYLNYTQKRKSAARGVIAWGHDDFLGPCMDFLMTSYFHALLHDCEASRKACGLNPSFAR